MAVISVILNVVGAIAVLAFFFHISRRRERQVEDRGTEIRRRADGVLRQAKTLQNRLDFSGDRTPREVLDEHLREREALFPVPIAVGPKWTIADLQRWMAGETARARREIETEARSKIWVVAGVLVLLLLLINLGTYFSF
jgi:hypothetical protein